MDRKYTISCKRNLDIITRQPLPENDKEWLVMCRDNGPMGSGEICFANTKTDIVYFESEQEAEKFWYKYCENSYYLSGKFESGEYDRDSLAVRKIIFKKCKKL